MWVGPVMLPEVSAGACDQVAYRPPPLPVDESRSGGHRVAGAQLFAVARCPGLEVRQRLQVGEVEVVLALACPGRDCDVAIPATRTRIRLPGSAIAWYELVGAPLVL